MIRKQVIIFKIWLRFLLMYKFEPKIILLWIKAEIDSSWECYCSSSFFTNSLDILSYTRSACHFRNQTRPQKLLSVIRNNKSENSFIHIRMYTRCWGIHWLNKIVANFRHNASKAIKCVGLHENDTDIIWIDKSLGLFL